MDDYPTIQWVTIPIYYNAGDDLPKWTGFGTCDNRNGPRLITAEDKRQYIIAQAGDPSPNAAALAGCGNNGICKDDGGYVAICCGDTWRRPKKADGQYVSCSEASNYEYNCNGQRYNLYCP